MAQISLDSNSKQQRRHHQRRSRGKVKIKLLFLFFFLTFGLAIVSHFLLFGEQKLDNPPPPPSLFVHPEDIPRSLRSNGGPNNNDNSNQRGARIVMAVLNGGKRKEGVDYFTPLYQDLLQLKQQNHGYLDLVVLSDQYNYNQDNYGEIRMPSFPTDQVFNEMLTSQGKQNKLYGTLSLHAFRISIMWYSLTEVLLSDFGEADAYFVTENDAVICNTTKLLATFDWFLSSSQKPSLSYWDSCHQRKQVYENDEHLSKWDITMYEKNPCGMVSTLLTKDALLKIQSKLQDSGPLFRWTIENIFKSTKTMDGCIKNGDVLVHGGYISTSGKEGEFDYGRTKFTCQDY